MVEVLVADDEQSYREYLGRYLASEGHEVRVAASGREAIEIGARFRPEVLVVDWMLKNHVHGLHVVEAIGAVQSRLATVMITGFPSRDLKTAAERSRIFRFIEKPFELEEIRQAVEQAAQSDAPRTGRAAPAVLETDAEGRILHANSAARELFRTALHAEEVESLAALFRPDAAPELEAAARAWVATAPAGPRAEVWYARTHEPRPGRTQLWLLRREGERANVPLTEMILGVREPLELRWPLEGRVLIVDDDELFRHVAVAVLESAGAPSYAVETEPEALRLLTHDEGIGVLVVDYEIPGTDVGSLVTRARGYRPDLRIVGNSAFDRSEEFAKLGVESFLRKPWGPRDLLEVLRG
jgi:DNA-binding NtrC family response regulator